MFVARNVEMQAESREGAITRHAQTDLLTPAAERIVAFFRRLCFLMRICSSRTNRKG